jgi:chromosomal replication initiation ATPase DnaA
VSLESVKLQQGSHDSAEKGGTSKSVEAILDELASRGLLALATKHAFAHHVTLGEILGEGRYRPSVWARQALWCELYSMGHFSYPSLGRLFSRAHTTILAGVQHHLARTGQVAA